MLYTYYFYKKCIKIISVMFYINVYVYIIRNKLIFIAYYNFKIFDKNREKSVFLHPNFGTL